MKKSRLLGVVCAFLINPAISYGSVIDLSDVNGFGYFQDSATGFTWMDVDNFLNMTFSEVSSLIQGSGFSIATRAQLEQLHNSSGDSYSTLAPIMGDSSQGDTGIMWGLYDHSLNPTGFYAWSWLRDHEESWSYDDVSGIPVEGGDLSEYTALGAWVVATSTFTPLPSAVPIPPALWLFGSGLIGLIGMARRKKVA